MAKTDYMADNNNDIDKLNFTGEEQKLPSGLNTLTILTIIGCVVGIIGSLWSFFSAKTNYEKTKDMMESGKLDEAPSFVKGMINSDTLLLQRKMLENKVPILILSLVAIALCLYGALEMRKRKKQGYTLWLIGEILPVAAGIFFIGITGFKGFGLIGIVIPLVFIILYTMRKKDLIY